MFNAFSMQIKNIEISTLIRCQIDVEIEVSMSQSVRIFLRRQIDVMFDVENAHKNTSTFSALSTYPKIMN